MWESTAGLRERFAAFFTADPKELKEATSWVRDLLPLLQDAQASPDGPNVQVDHYCRLMRSCLFLALKQFNPRLNAVKLCDVDDWFAGEDLEDKLLTLQQWFKVPKPKETAAPTLPDSVRPVTLVDSIRFTPEKGKDNPISVAAEEKVMIEGLAETWAATFTATTLSDEVSRQKEGAANLAARKDISVAVKFITEALHSLERRTLTKAELEQIDAGRRAACQLLHKTLEGWHSVLTSYWSLRSAELVLANEFLKGEIQVETLLEYYEKNATDYWEVIRRLPFATHRSERWRPTKPFQQMAFALEALNQWLLTLRAFEDVLRRLKPSSSKSGLHKDFSVHEMAQLVLDTCLRDTWAFLAFVEKVADGGDHAGGQSAATRPPEAPRSKEPRSKAALTTPQEATVSTAIGPILES